MSVAFDETRSVLAQPLIARLATIDADGYPHVVPLWFDAEPDRPELIIMADRTAHAVQNALGNPRGAVQVGGEPLPLDPAQYTTAYLYQGDFSVETDIGHTAMKRISRRYLHPGAVDLLHECWKDDDVVVVRLFVRKVMRVH
ncbi:MAG: pyridoxamine 5'-phosphate oxidase family protein [bacterium]|nr:pyridoxamine 5'-phosphate oxidase family protein [bacterium]